MLAAAGAPHPPQPTRPGPGDRRGRRVDRRPAGRPAAGVVFALASCAGFMLYVIPGHRIANTAPDGTTGRAGNSMSGIDQLGAAMIVATLLGITGAAPTLCTRTGCCGASASDCAPRSSPTSPTSSRWPGSRAPCRVGGTRPRPGCCRGMEGAPGHRRRAVVVSWPVGWFSRVVPSLRAAGRGSFPAGRGAG